MFTMRWAIQQDSQKKIQFAEFETNTIEYY